MEDTKYQYKGDLFNMESVLDKSKELPALKMVVVAPYDEATLRAVVMAGNEGVISPILIGEERKIRENADKFGIPLKSANIVDTDNRAMLEKSAFFISSGKADYIMKGMIATNNLLHVLLDPKWKIRTERILSHVGMFEILEDRRIFLMSDCAINILPNFTRKIHIVANAVDAARKIGIKNIRVAMLAAVEKINLPAMPATLDAFLMRKFSKTGYFNKCEIEGPFALDNALDPYMAATKGMGGRVAGRANIIIVPNIESGNVIYKSITCLHKRLAAGVVVGGSCPMVVSSRSDNYKVKLQSIKFAKLLLN